MGPGGRKIDAKCVRLNVMIPSPAFFNQGHPGFLKPPEAVDSTNGLSKRLRAQAVCSNALDPSPGTQCDRRPHVSRPASFTSFIRLRPKCLAIEKTTVISNSGTSVRAFGVLSLISHQVVRISNLSLPGVSLITVLARGDQSGIYRSDDLVFSYLVLRPVFVLHVSTSGASNGEEHPSDAPPFAPCLRRMEQGLRCIQWTHWILGIAPHSFRVTDQQETTWFSADPGLLPSQPRGSLPLLGPLARHLRETMILHRTRHRFISPGVFDGYPGPPCTSEL